MRHLVVHVLTRENRELARSSRIVASISGLQMGSSGLSLDPPKKGDGWNPKVNEQVDRCNDTAKAMRVRKEEERRDSDDRQEPGQVDVCIPSNDPNYDQI